MGKELSIEQKAKAYDEAFNVAMETYQTQPMYRDWLEKMFPELAESEDERIRKAIRYAIGQSTHSDGTLINGVSSEEAVAWLEKQGEQKPYGQRQECVDCQFNYAGECKGSCAMKRGEQKPTWSEEDEGFRKLLIAIMEVEYPKGTFSAYGITPFCGTVSVQRVIDWLKSLRQNKWKPSYFQIEALESATENCAYSEYQDCLRELIEQLKKLKD